MRRGLLTPANTYQLPTTQMKSVGLSGNIAAGRVLTVADFTTIGKSTPKGLWNLSNTSDSSGNAVTLTNPGGVTFTSGITGASTEAAQFSGGTAVYLSAPNASTKTTYGTWGAWIRTTPGPVTQYIMTQSKGTADFAFEFAINNVGLLVANVSVDGTTSNYWTQTGQTNVSDGEWHFVAFSWDGTKIQTYVDGKIDSGELTSVAGSPAAGPMYQSASALLMIGGTERGTGYYFQGRIDEAFVTADVLSADDLRFLYASRLSHGCPSPMKVRAHITNRRRTATFTSSDFSTQPLVGYNFNSGALTTDNFGSLGKTLTNNNTVSEAPDLDGKTTGAANFNGTNQYFSGTDTGLPSGTSARSLGAWVKLNQKSTSHTIIEYGTTSGSNTCAIGVDAEGKGYIASGATSVTGGLGANGQWHFLVGVFDNSAFDGYKMKLYIDGRLVAVSTTFTSTTLGGANKLTIGTQVGAASLFAQGQMANAFITNYALTPEEIRGLYHKQGVSYLTRNLVEPDKTEWQGVSVKKSATQAIANGAWTLLTWDSEFFDSEDMHSQSSNTSRLYARSSGVFLIMANVTYTNAGTGVRGLGIVTSGGSFVAVDVAATIGAGDYHPMHVAVPLNLAAGDYVEVYVYQSSGGALNTLADASNTPTKAAMWKVGDYQDDTVDQQGWLVGWDSSAVYTVFADSANAQDDIVLVVED